MKNIKLLLILFFILLFVPATILNAEFIDFYPDIKPLHNYTLNLKYYLQGKKKNSRYFIVREQNIFHNSKEILTAVQGQLIQFAIIPLRTLNNLDISGNIKHLLQKIYSIKDIENNEGELIPLKLELDKYGIFLISVLPGTKYFLFSNMKDMDKSKNSTIALAVTNDLYLKKFKKIYPNSLLVNNLDILRKSNIFNSAVMSVTDYLISDKEFKNVYDCNLSNEKYCFIANKNYWLKMSQKNKSLFWSFNDKNNKLFRIDIKMLQDKTLSNLIINKLSF